MNIPTRRLLISSRAEARLEAARQWLAALAADAEVLVLAPHAHAAAELVRGVAQARGSLFGVHRLTPDRLAARLAAPGLARRGWAPATGLSLAAVATRAVHRLVGEGTAGRYAEVARRPGFPHALVRTVTELRAAGVAPTALRAVDRDLAALLETIEAEMAEVGLADRAATLAEARAAVERGEAPPPVGAPLLLVDLPVEHALEGALLAALAARAPAVLAIAAAGDPAVKRIEAALGTRAETADDTENGSLAALQRHLFEDTRPEPLAEDGGVRVTSAPGEARECVEIARRIRAEAAAGTPFDRMAVFLRAPYGYRAHLEEALRRADVPAYFARGTQRPDPAGRAMLALLACAAEGLSARRFAEYLSLAQVPDPGAAADAWMPPAHELLPAALEPAPDGNGAAHRPPDPDAPVLEGTLRAPWRWERLLVDAAVIGGRERWRRRLDGLAAELYVQREALHEEDARAAGLQRAVADLEHLRTFALPLIDRLADLPGSGAWAEWLAHLRALAGAALRHPERVLAVLAELEPLSPVGPVELSDVQHVLAPRLRDLGVEASLRAEGAVFVAPIEAARGVAFDVVFVPGLAEKVFPPKIVEDPLLPDALRGTLGRDRPAIQDDRVAAERLNLRLAAGAARRHLALSWPRLDLEQARPRVPSFYGLEALRAAEGRLPGFDELRRRAESAGASRLGWPAPERPADAIDDAEYDLAVLAPFVRNPGGAEHRGAAGYLLHVNPVLTRALSARVRRWKEMWTSADGLVPPHDKELGLPPRGPIAAGQHRLAMQVLKRHRMGERSFSPTALENFSSCPYRFLLQAIHRLQPREESEALEFVDPLTRGALFHEVQFRFLTRMRDAGRLPVQQARMEEATAWLEETVEAVAAEYREKLAPAIPRVWEDGIAVIRADLREWLRRGAEADDGWVPHRFELSFGLGGPDSGGRKARTTADADSVAEPVTILGRAKLRGSIDLLERRADGTLRVTDHKTGKARTPVGVVINGGQALQPALYALVAEANLGARVESGRLYYCTADGDFTERVIPLDEISREYAGKAIDLVANAIDEGFLPAAPREGACLWCDYRTVCGPSEERRTARKPKEALAPLLALRDLP